MKLIELIKKVIRYIDGNPVAKEYIIKAAEHQVKTLLEDPRISLNEKPKDEKPNKKKEEA